MQNVHIFSGLMSGQVIAGRFTAPRGLADLGCLKGANGLDQGFMAMRPF
jgi:hypothetical protein